METGVEEADRVADQLAAVRVAEPAVQGPSGVQNIAHNTNGAPLPPAAPVVANSLQPRPPSNQARVASDPFELVHRAYPSSSTSRNHSADASPMFSPNDGAPVYNWQATMKCVQERNKYLFNNEILADVHFLVGREDARQRIPAHKLVLSSGSAVFDALFNGTLATQADEVEIPDVEPTAFLALLKFLYYDAKDIDSDSVMTTLYTAKKYAVPALEAHCVEFLEENLRSDNAFMLLTQARLFDEPILASMCLDCIDKNTAEAFSADGFSDIDLDSLCLVLERDTLVICEARLFQAVVGWAEAECMRQNLGLCPENLRKVLGRALYLIRFPLMTMEQFAMGPVMSDILTPTEAVQMFLFFVVNPKPPVDFIETPRCCSTGNEITVCRFPHIESRWGYSGTSDRVRFLVDRRITIVGFGLYGSTGGPAEYEVLLQLIHTQTGKICGSTATGFTCDGSNYTFRVPFKDPVEIQPNTSYIAAATLKGPDSYYGTRGLRKVCIEVPGSGKVTFQFSYAAGNNNGTSVEDGQIPELIFHM